MGGRSELSQKKVAQLFRRRREENTKMKHLALLSMVTLASCAPQSLVVTTTSPPCVDDQYDEGCIEVNDSSTISTTTTTTTSTTTLSTTTTTEKLVATEPLETTKFHIKSEFQFRYARTVVESAVSNPDTVAQVGSFALVIPDSAFISAFSMEMDGEEFKARVEEKEEAEKTFEKALSRGRGAGLVSQDAKDANKFTVSTNIEGGQEVVFRLTYDELLGRKEGMYRQEINIDPQQIVEDFRVEVFINESLPITEVNVPELLQSNSIDPSEETQNSFVTIEKDFEGDAKKAKIVFAPTAIEQRVAAEEGMSGRLQINYDVDRQNQDSEVQLKDAMFTVLDDMKPEDFFNIITFSTSVNNWSPSGITEEGNQIAIPATKENKKKAISHVLDLEAEGGTNINSAMLTGLELAKEVLRSESLPQGVASMLVFLSDGEATEGETSGKSIKANVAEANSDTELPIFSVAFGSGADFDLLKEISLAADSFAKRVYEGSDAALQLENFYAEISSPVVTNLKFDYVGGLVDNSSLSNGKVRTLFKGDQYVVVGKLLSEASGPLTVHVTADKTGAKYLDDIVIDPCLRQPKIVEESSSPTVIESFDCIQPIPDVQKSKAQEFPQSLHAFLNIQQLLKKDKKAEALTLALENHFVTPVTSLVVVRPDEEDSLADVDDDPTIDYDYPPMYSMSYAAPAAAAYQPQRFASNIVGGHAYLASPQAYRPKSKISPIAASNSYHLAYDDTGSGYESFSYYDAAYDYVDDYAAITSTTVRNNLARTTTTTTFSTSTTSTTTSQPETCQLTLYSKTYNRGEELVLLDDSADLGSFSDVAISALVEGSCCWQLFGEVNFGGPSAWVRPGGVYKGTDSFGRELFQEVSSLRRVQC